MLKLGATDYDWGSRGAMAGCNTDIVALMINLGATDVIKFYDYKLKPFEVIKLIEAGLDPKYLNNIDGYDLLKYDLNNFKQETKLSLSPYLLDPIINIIQSYSVL
jgi:hypothetical protein